MIQINTHQNNRETITLNVSQETDITGLKYLSQHIYSVVGARVLIDQLNQASFELSEWVQSKEKGQKNDN